MTAAFMINLVGAVALAVQVYVLLRPHNKNLLAILSGIMFIWAVHYWALGSPAAAGMHVWAAIVMWAGILGKSKSRTSRIVIAWVATGINLIIGSALYQQTADLFMLAGNVAFGLCNVLLADRALRWGYIGAEALIAIAAFLLGSIPGFAIAMIMIGSNARAISRWSPKPAREQ